MQSLEEELEEAKRHFALKEWPQAVNAYAEVLETMREKHSEEEAVFAPVFHRYGHALLELAISTSGALGGGGSSKEAFLPDAHKAASVVASKPAKAVADEEGTQASASSSAAAASSSKPAEKTEHDPRFTFGGDAEESEEEQDASGVANGAEGEEEDDLGLAFSILEIARVLYEKALSSDESLKTIDGDEWSSVMIRSQLAEVLNDLADVGLESENFQQASTDYKSSLDILTPLLQPHSRRLADAYLRLGLALEFHPDASLQSTAGKYVTGACTTLEKRLDSLQARQRVLQKEIELGESGLAKAAAAASALRAEKAEAESEKRLKDEGIEAASESKDVLFEKDDVAIMDWDQTEREIKDVKEMITELKQKLEDYANNSLINGANGSSSSAGGSAKEKVQAAINEVLLGSSTNVLGAPPSNPNAPVNDLSAMVKKKKKPTITEESADVQGKRKEISETTSEESNKKVKVD